ncbi:hypothetical protein ABW19_dt0202712 [Dactylella cylindrospora]|nr:hypothetical protein ABW19_dt0202712 [Dactylella cylindrospora]
MTSFLAKFVLGRIFQESAANKEGREDPYYEYPAQELNKAGKRKSKRRKKALPPGLTDEEGEILTKVKRRAYRLDMSFGSLFGVRFGWGSVIGIVPAIGDVLDALLSLMVVKTAMNLDLPTGLVIHMMFNIVLDFVIGIVPIIGDLLDAGYKCSTRNAVLLEKHLREVGRKRLKAEGINNPEDDSLPGGYETPPEEIDLESQAPRPQRQRTFRNGSTRREDAPDRTGTGDWRERPERTHSKSLQKSRTGEGKRGGGSRRDEGSRREEPRREESRREDSRRGEGSRRDGSRR